jgi:hypothetical protein
LNSTLENKCLEKFKRFCLVDDYMSNLANIATHVQVRAYALKRIQPIVSLDEGFKLEGRKRGTSSNYMIQKKDNIFMPECIKEVKDSGEKFLQVMRATEKSQIATVLVHARDNNKVGRGTFIIY